MVWPAPPRLRAESSVSASVSESTAASRSPSPTGYSHRIASKSATATVPAASVSVPNSAFQQQRQSYVQSQSHWRHSGLQSPSPSIPSSSHSSTIPSTASFPQTAFHHNYTHMRSPSPSRDEQEIWSQTHQDYPPFEATQPFSEATQPFSEATQRFSNDSHPAYQSYLSPSSSQDDDFDDNEDDNETESENENENDNNDSFIPSAQPRFTNFTPHPPFTPSAPLSSLPSPPSSTISRRPSSIVSFTDSQPTLRQGHRNVSPSIAPSVHRHRARRVTRQGQEDAESHMLNAVVEGMGRIHVTMDQDAAGRWRIKRQSDSRFENR
ncbi:hypothetical protein PT974_07453 [Cladobotryum mycophilum]|uniref:REJ domain-containing protein n=1 Tax=Cladobotryum mycophilum TaxID=491253 RepID=A0ABR0SPI1_9HYPO